MCETEVSENGQKDDGRQDENYHCPIRDRDDKWTFQRSVLDRIARENRAEVLTYGLHDNVGQFRRHFSYMLETHGGMKAADYPKWAWKIFDRYDKEMFSPEMLLDLALEGCIMFRKLP
jgi:hypothetical protein